MRIGIFGGTGPDIDRLIASAQEVADAGFPRYWLPQVFGPDALTALAVLGREVPDIELGTSVVPTFPRHPMILAQQALTTNTIVGGRLTLGIGLSHQVVVEGMWGMDFDRPVRHMREYLAVLGALINEGAVDYDGETLSAHARLDLSDPEPCTVLVAALGPQMLRLAGREADGTITWMTGASTIRDHTAPTIAAAASDAGRPDPQVVCAIPVCVTDDGEAARSRAAEQFAVYGDLPSYRAMLDRQGAAGPADVAVIGDEDSVAEQIDLYRQAGVTEFVASEFGADSDERARTRAALTLLL